MKELIGKKTGKRYFVPHHGELVDAIESGDNTGWCIACGEQAGSVEPDARGYQCECCNARKVYGAEQLLLMGLYCLDAA